MEPSVENGGEKVQIEFRIAEYADLPDIIKLTDECFEEKTDLEYAERVWRENENDDKQIYVNGIVNGEVVAHGKITIIPTIYEDMNIYALLNHICVRPDMRRHGFGRKLLEEMERICRERGCVEMVLWSKNFRQPAHEMYKRYGFLVEDAKFFKYLMK